VDDQLRTSDPDVYGVGECVQHRGMVYGLVAPIWEQTKVLADVLTGRNPEARYEGSKLATKLKVMGVELASMGRVGDVKPTDEVIQFGEPARQVYWKAIVREGKVVAGCLLGDLGPADDLVRLFMSEAPAPARRLELFSPRRRTRRRRRRRTCRTLTRSATATGSARGRSAPRSRPASARCRRSARRPGPAPAAGRARSWSRG
jgi:NAD(P)H-nitrite reductase large subunit